MDINNEYKNPCLDKYKRQVNPYVYGNDEKNEISIARHVVIVTMLVAKYVEILGFSTNEKEIAIEIALSHEDSKQANGDDTPQEVDKKFVSESTNNYLKMYKGDFSNVKPENVEAMKKIVNAVLIVDSLAMELEMAEGYSRAIKTNNNILKDITIKTTKTGGISVEIVEDNEYLERRKEEEDFLNGRGYYDKLAPDHKIQLIDYYLDTMYGTTEKKENNNSLVRKI